MTGIFERDEPIYGQMTTNTRSCDKCTASALFLVKDLDLAFCGHHRTENEDALSAYGIVPLITLTPEVAPEPEAVTMTDEDQPEECNCDDCNPVDPEFLETTVKEMTESLDAEIEFVQKMPPVMAEAFIEAGHNEPNKSEL